MFSLDAAYCNLTRYDLSHDSDFTPEQSVESVSFLPVANSKGLSVIVPPWHAPDWLMQRRAKHENALGYSALYLTLNNNVLSADAERTLDSFTVISDRIADEVTNIGEHPERWMAFSLGASILMYTLGEKPMPANRINLVAPGGDLAHSLWNGRRTAQLRCQFVLQGMRLPKLQNAWRQLSPIHQANKINPTSFSLTLSQADKVIPPDSAVELVAALEGAGHDVDLHTNRYRGHYGTILASVL